MKCALVFFLIILFNVSLVNAQDEVIALTCFNDDFHSTLGVHMTNIELVQTKSMKIIWNMSALKGVLMDKLMIVFVKQHLLALILSR